MNDYGVSLEKSVGLVARQEKLEKSGMYAHRASFGQFSWVPKSNVVRKG